jgi:hypothetical protein
MAVVLAWPWVPLAVVRPARMDLEAGGSMEHR